MWVRGRYPVNTVKRVKTGMKTRIWVGLGVKDRDWKKDWLIQKGCQDSRILLRKKLLAFIAKEFVSFTSVYAAKGFWPFRLYIIRKRYIVRMVYKLKKGSPKTLLDPSSFGAPRLCALMRFCRWSSSVAHSALRQLPRCAMNAGVALLPRPVAQKQKSFLTSIGQT